MSDSPEVTVVIPVFNEEAILDTAVRALIRKLRDAGYSFELLLAENGSTDGTVAAARRLQDELEVVRLLQCYQPNYGRALRQGIEAARGELIVCDEIDLGDISFYTRAIDLLRDGADMVVGSKRHPQSTDSRPWLRRRGTQVMNGLLRIALNFEGTDTHGLKAFRRQPLAPVVAQCIVEHNLFASELVLRAHRGGLEVREIPLTVKEIRPPSVGLMRRVPQALGDLAKLVYVIRIGRNSDD